LTVARGRKQSARFADVFGILFRKIAASLSRFLAYMIDADPAIYTVKSSDHLHFDAAGQIALGKAFASKVISVAAVPKPSTGALLLGPFALLVCRLASRKKGRARLLAQR
jgi:hypothetical protein